MKTFRWCLVVLLAGGAWAAEKFTPEQLAARYYFDLGPAAIDVSSYPAEHKKAYESFAHECADCHTLARPINAPFVERKDWSRYVTRMHLRHRLKSGSGFSKAEGKAIVDFLAYDSKIRKIQGKANFEAEGEKLKVLFEDVKKEKLKLIEADNHKKAKTREQAPAPGQ